MTNQPNRPPGPGAAPLDPTEEQLWASLAHFGNILGFIPALLILLLMKGRSARVGTEAKEALNWSITVAIALAVLGVVDSVAGSLGAASPGGAGIGTALIGLLIGLLTAAVVVVNILFSIIGGTRVAQGGSYRYPYSLRLVA